MQNHISLYTGIARHTMISVCPQS